MSLALGGRCQYCMYGIGTAPHSQKPGRQADVDYPDLAKEAGTAALADARIAYNAVEQVVAGYVYGISAGAVVAPFSFILFRVTRRLHVWATRRIHTWAHGSPGLQRQQQLRDGFDCAFPCEAARRGRYVPLSWLTWGAHSVRRSCRQR